MPLAMLGAIHRSSDSKHFIDAVSESDILVYYI